MAQPLALGFLCVWCVCVCVIVPFWWCLRRAEDGNYSTNPDISTCTLRYRTPLHQPCHTEALLSMECGVSFLHTSTTPPSPAGEKLCRSFSSYPKISWTARRFLFSFPFCARAFFLGTCLVGAGGARRTKVRAQHFTSTGSAAIAINGDYCTLQDTGLGGGGWSPPSSPPVQPASQPASEQANCPAAQRAIARGL